MTVLCKIILRPAVEEILTEYIQDVDISEENREFMIRMYDLFWVDLVMRWIQTGMEISEMTGDIENDHVCHDGVLAST